MKYRFSTLIFGALLCLFSHNLCAQGFSILIDSAEVQAGQNVCLKVKSKGFVDITSFQFSISWDAQVLQYINVKNFGLFGLSSGNFAIPSPNHLLVAWSDPAGSCFSKADGETLFELCFKAIGGPGNFSLVSAGSSGFPAGGGSAETYNCFGQSIWNQMCNDTGLVNIVPFVSSANSPNDGVVAFQLSPNPTQTSSNVIFNAKALGNGSLFVTDALGRTVFTQKIFVNAGENKVEIPANTLKVKGMYQVSVQTKDGANSQMLSVQ